MDFAAPHLLWLLLAVPGAAAVATLLWRRRLRATARWSARGLWPRLVPSYHRHRLAVTTVLVLIALAAVVVALARPRWGGGSAAVERRGVDCVFVLDTSLSMATRDVPSSRLWVAQTLIRRLVRELPGHRVALVQAEGDGVVMVPLTTDAAVVDLFLDAARPGSLPTPGTRLAPALERALALYPEDEDRPRVLVVVSDGEDHGSELAAAATRLAAGGVVVHTIGVGTPEGMPLELPPHHPLAPGYKLDAGGRVVLSRLVAASLEELSRTTGGLYLAARSPAAELDELVERIDALDREALPGERASSREERFQWPVAVAVVALVLHLLIAPFRPHPEETP